MAIEIMTKDQAQKNKTLTAISYGLSGTGKSTAAIKGIKNAAIINYEDGLGDIEPGDGTVIINCYDAGDFREAIDYIVANKKQFDTVVLDSLSKYGDKLFAALSEIYPDKSDSMNLWGSFDTVSRQRFEQLMSTGLNIIIIALEDQVVLDSGFRGSFVSYKGKRFKSSLEAQVDIIMYHSKDQDGNMVRDWKGSNIHVGKNRFSMSLGDDAMKYETYQEMIDTLQSK